MKKNFYEDHKDYQERREQDNKIWSLTNQLNLKVNIYQFGIN